MLISFLGNRLTATVSCIGSVQALQSSLTYCKPLSGLSNNRLNHFQDEAKSPMSGKCDILRHFGKFLPINVTFHKKLITQYRKAFQR